MYVKLRKRTRNQSFLRHCMPGGDQKQLSSFPGCAHPVVFAHNRNTRFSTASFKTPKNFRLRRNERDQLATVGFFKNISVADLKTTTWQSLPCAIAAVIRVTGKTNKKTNRKKSGIFRTLPPCPGTENRKKAKISGQFYWPRTEMTRCGKKSIKRYGGLNLPPHTERREGRKKEMEKRG